MGDSVLIENGDAEDDDINGNGNDHGCEDMVMFSIKTVMVGGWTKSFQSCREKEQRSIALDKTRIGLFLPFSVARFLRNFAPFLVKNYYTRGNVFINPLNFSDNLTPIEWSIIYQPQPDYESLYASICIEYNLGQHICGQ